MPKPLDPALRDWLNPVVYPRLSCSQVFGSLSGYREGINDRVIRVIAALARVTTGPHGDGLIAHPEAGMKSHRNPTHRINGA